MTVEHAALDGWFQLDEPALQSALDRLARAPLYGGDDAGRDALFAAIATLTRRAAEQHAGYRRLVESWPVPLAEARTLADLPFLHVSAFKRRPTLALVDDVDVRRRLTSSATSGQTPSLVAVDGATARRMSRAAARIFADHIGGSRRPFLVIDAGGERGAGQIGARSAAARGLMPFASSVAWASRCAKSLTLDMDALLAFAEAHADEPVLIYGFTWILWLRFARELRRRGVSLGLRRAHVLHSGGWKRLEAERVDRRAFAEGVAAAVGCDAERVVDFYGMVENVGVVYPDCEAGLKHAPESAFGAVIVRDPATLAPARPGATGLVQVCSALPTSFPGHALLTDDLAEVVCLDGCSCGRRGLGFRFVGRAAQSEARGCSDTHQEAA